MWGCLRNSGKSRFHRTPASSHCQAWRPWSLRCQLCLEVALSSRFARSCCLPRCSLCPVTAWFRIKMPNLLTEMGNNPERLPQLPSPTRGCRRCWLRPRHSPAAPPAQCCFLLLPRHRGGARAHTLTHALHKLSSALMLLLGAQQSFNHEQLLRHIISK